MRGTATVQPARIAIAIEEQCWKNGGPHMNVQAGSHDTLLVLTSALLSTNALRVFCR